MKRLSKRAAAEMARLMNRAPDGLLKPQSLVRFARDKETALHRFFEWDDSKAAAKYRIDQARSVIQVWVEVNHDGDPPSRVLVSLSTDQPGGGGYREMRKVLNSREMTATLFADAVTDLARWRDRYFALARMAKFKKLDVVFQEVDRLSPQKKP